MLPTSVANSTEVWARNEFNKVYCNAHGKQSIPINVENFKRDLEKKRPDDAVKIGEAIKRRAIRGNLHWLDVEISKQICQQFVVDENGGFEDYAGVIIRLHHMRPDLAKNGMVVGVVDDIEKLHQTTLKNLDRQLPRKRTCSPEIPKEHPLPAGIRAQVRSQTSVSASSSIPTPPKQKMKAKPAVKPARKTLSHAEVEEFVRKEYQHRYHDASGKLKMVPEPTNSGRLCQTLRPGHSEGITRVVKSIDEELSSKLLTSHDSSELLTWAQLECNKLSWTHSTRDLNRAVVITAVASRRPDIHRKRVEAIVRKAEECQEISKRHAAMTMSATTKQNVAAPSPTKPAPKLIEGPMDAYVYQQYEQYGFDSSGFKGFKWLLTHLEQQRPSTPKHVFSQVVKRLRYAGTEAKYPFGDVNKIAKQRKADEQAQSKPKLTATNGANSQTTFPSAFPKLSSTDQATLVDPTSLASYLPPPMPEDQNPKKDLLARKMNQLHLSNDSVGSSDVPSRGIEDPDGDGQDHDSGVDVPSPAYDAFDDVEGAQHSSAPTEVDHCDMAALLSNSSEDEDRGEETTDEFDTEIQHAPLLDEDFISDDSRNLIPQYGLMGSHNEFSDGKSKLFLNTNSPFSAFICGVQGSGKSHTASCIMENALISSMNLGKLQSPLSSLVFSYGHFSGDGSGYSISEAAFLAAPHPKMPGGAHVRKVNVFVSPSNYVRMSKLYLRVPNVTVIPFRLKPWNLDIDVMLTLMNVSESGEQPLYMAQVTQILRQLATTGGPFNYMAFKTTLQAQKFNPTQVNMLQMRLNLLESFLDLRNESPEPQFRPGEITIMDMSCPFVDPSTACILFRIGLQRYLQSDSAGKMIVLDEAHKYMLNVPGAKALNETLLQTIRLQRHYGARVVISTQEPTLLTDLIALCSITFIYRFSSPEWLAAIKRHIPMSPQAAQTLMNKIESLKTGNALVYSSNAVLGWNDDDQLIKGTGKMVRVSIRKRITSDGGQSVLAV